MSKIFNKAFTIVTAAVFVAILVLLFFATHEDLSIGNYVLMPLSIMLLLFIYKRKITLSFKNIISLSIILMIISFIICWNIYFYTGWDSGEIMIPAARLLASGENIQYYSVYFSWAENNLYLLQIYRIIFSLANILNLLYSNYDLLFVIFLNCIIAAFSNILIYMTIINISNDQHKATFGYIMGVVLIMFSPWSTICYSDAISIFSPILVIYIYTKDLKNNYLKFGIITFISIAMYNIKPQNLIVLVAIIIIEISSFDRKCFRNLCIIALAGVLTLSFTGLVKSEMIKRTNFNYNPEQAATLHHYLMMGLNKDSGGEYNQDDVNFSSSIENKEERIDANIETIKHRIKEMGVFGLLDLAKDKTLRNYNDGTFGWGNEGRFYAEIFEPPLGKFSEFLRSFYYEGEDNYTVYVIITHLIWLGIVALQLLNINKDNKKIQTVLLSIIGITMFEVIFECRARYMYIYLPLFIVAASIGVENIFKIRKLKNSNKITF